MKDSLFDLIGALTRSEKRYFKLFASRHTIGEENNYVTLFNYIEKLPNYDEQAIFQKFSGESFLNNFTITKKRLYDNILISLESFHLSNSEEALWTRQLHSAEILMGKTLSDQAKKIINSVEKQAAKKENNLILQKVLRLKNTYQAEFAILENTNAKKEVKEEHLIENETHYYKLIKSLRRLRSGAKFDGSMVEIPKVFTIENRLLLQQIQIVGGFKGKADQDFYALINDNFILFQQQADLVKKHFFTFLELNRYAALQSIRNMDFQGARKILANVQKIDCENENQANLKNSFEFLIGLEVELGAKNTKEVGVQLEKIQNAFSNNDFHLNREIHKELQFKMAAAYLLLGNYSGALSQINQLFQENDLEGNEEQSAMIYILDCIIHYELKHYDYLQYAIKNSIRQLKSKAIFADYHKIIFGTLTKLSTTESKLDKEEILFELKETISKQQSNCKQNLFPIIEWISTKLKLISADAV